MFFRCFFSPSISQVFFLPCVDKLFKMAEISASLTECLREVSSNEDNLLIVDSYFSLAILPSGAGRRNIKGLHIDRLRILSVDGLSDSKP